ncbi:class F sortase [Alkalicoccus halolimnae]|uniref:Class F sortase n=1 Tax=Alkalicoccus halolimnae TaxID=1667239 RepID=A0A5C7F007_9BACI|nr:class F sortase [Alkalicoccus halolimnae]TXF82317.1 class F sortase [Alkalicoccus halolimnae]
MQLFSFVKSLQFKHKLILIFSTVLFTACSAEEGRLDTEDNEQQMESAQAEETEDVEPIQMAQEDPDSSEQDNEPGNSSSDEPASADPIEPVYGSTSRGMEPARLVIPAIGVDAPIDNMGLEPDGAMAVPDNGDDIGWFEPGTKPGAQGNSVLAGHVDDREGPAVFYDLKELESGDEIKVMDESGEELVFVVTHKETYPYDDAPIDTVFGSSSSRNLNLITCTGEFDRNAGTHRERLVVFTEML